MRGASVIRKYGEDRTQSHVCFSSVLHLGGQAPTNCIKVVRKYRCACWLAKLQWPAAGSFFHLGIEGASPMREQVQWWCVMRLC